VERVMLARAGRSRPMEHALIGHFKRPCRDDGTVLDEPGFARMLDEYYVARGWDQERGWPESATLGRLELEEAEPVMEAVRVGAR
jgi:aldehyde:ferredoxin oxidoreductase